MLSRLAIALTLLLVTLGCEVVPVPGSGATSALVTVGPFATAGDVTLMLPSAEATLVGFHESGHDGARQLEPTDRPPSITMDSRNRGTGSRSAADIALPAGRPVLSPVTGTVVRAGGYVLYCRHHDDFVVIEPDDRPGWEVKVLHIAGVEVRPGDRVTAGITRLAPSARRLPFTSQIDDHTPGPAGPHLHIEVVDPSIVDRTPGGGC